MNIIVVGGGFGGVKAALELSKRHVGKITLISDEDYFLHHATLYATATGKSMAESVLPLKDIFMHYPNVTIVKDKITALDEKRHLVISKNKQYRYDALILALGSVTTYFGIKGLAQHAFGIKSLDEISKFHDHLHDEVVRQKLDKEYVVIGAGPTGVELAGALNEYLKYLISANRLKHSRAKVVLIEAAPRIVPRLSKAAARIITKRLKKVGIGVKTNMKVEGMDDEALMISGQKLHTTTAIWTSGVANNPFFTDHEHQFHLAPNGRVNVDEHLEALKDVYVIGDGNSVKYSGMAWPAMQQARFVAKHLSKKITKRQTVKFYPRSVPCGLPVGEDWGYVEWLGFYVSGRTGALVRRWMELYGYCQLMPFSQAVRVWRAHDIAQVED